MVAAAKVTSEQLVRGLISALNNILTVYTVPSRAFVCCVEMLMDCFNKIMGRSNTRIATMLYELFV